MDLFTMILQLALVVSVVGLVVFILVSYVPMPDPFPKLIIGLAAILTVLWIVRYVTGWHVVL